MQHQGSAAAIDGSFQLQFDVVADCVLFRHFRAESSDPIPPELFGRQQSPDRLGAVSPKRVSRPGSPTATPILTVRLTFSPSISTCLCRLRFCSAARRARHSRDVYRTVGTTTNSSPPKLATTDGMSTASRSSPAKALRNGRQHSDRGGPLITLRRSKSSDSTATGPGCRQPVAHRGGRSAPAVQQAGQIIVFGEVAAPAPRRRCGPAVERTRWRSPAARSVRPAATPGHRT